MMLSYTVFISRRLKMAAWLNRTTKQHIPRRSPRNMEEQFGGSFVDGSGNAQGNATWIYQPDLSSVVGVLARYWIITGDVVSEMDAAAKVVVDQAILDASRNSLADQFDDQEGVMRAFALANLDEINILRGQHGLGNRTISQLKSAIRDKLGS